MGECIGVFDLSTYLRANTVILTLTHLVLSDLLQEYGVKLNVIGRRSLFPESVQTAVRKAEELTEGNNR